LGASAAIGSAAGAGALLLLLPSQHPFLQPVAAAPAIAATGVGVLSSFTDEASMGTICNQPTNQKMQARMKQNQPEGRTGEDHRQ